MRVGMGSGFDGAGAAPASVGTAVEPSAAAVKAPVVLRKVRRLVLIVGISLTPDSRDGKGLTEVMGGGEDGEECPSHTTTEVVG